MFGLIALALVIVCVPLSGACFFMADKPFPKLFKWRKKPRGSKGGES
jgi:hypothetical protein